MRKDTENSRAEKRVTSRMTRLLQSHPYRAEQMTNSGVATGVIHAVAVSVMLIAVGSTTASDDAEKAPVPVIAALVDGSHVIGVPSLSSMPLKTTYGKLDVPVRDLWGIRFPKEGRTVGMALRNGDFLTGELLLESLDVSTLFGRASIDLEHVTFLGTDTRSQTFLPADWRYYDLLPIVRDPSRWRGRDDVQYRPQLSFDAGVDIDGQSDCDLAVSRTGLIVLSDLDRSHTISVYSPAGKLLRRLRAPHHPSGVALSPGGGILVSSNFGHLKLFTPMEAKTETYDIRTTDDVSSGFNGKAYAIDSRGCAIVELGVPDSRTVVKLDGYQSGMKKIFIDARGRIFLADWAARTVSIYAQDGTTIGRLKTKGMPWSVVASGSLLCYSTGRELVFYNFETAREVHRIRTTHRSSALALGPWGELLTIDESRDRVHVYRARGTEGRPRN